MKFEFAAPSALDKDNRSANTARLLNMYREPVGDGAVWCKSLPGMTTFATIDRVFCRAMAEIEDEIYLVQGGTLYRVSTAGIAVELGAVSDSSETTISSNNGKVTVVAGGRYFVWDGSALTEPATGAFDDFGDVTFFGQLTVLTERNGRRVQWSNVADPDTLGGLDFATTEARDDKNLRVLPVGSALWFFKETSIEPWFQDGTGVAAIPGGTIERGLKARNLVTVVPGGAFFVADDGSAYLASSGLERVSTVAVETSIAEETPVRAFYFEDEGHKFCALIFADRPAWVYDIATGEWCERGQGNTLGPWGARACVKARGTFYVGTEGGVVATLGRTNEDLGETMVRQIVSRTVENDGRRFQLPSVQVQTRVGFFYDEPQITVEMSDTFGLTWKIYRQQSLGKPGEYLRRTVFRRLGQYRQATMRVTLSAPVDITVNAVVFT